MKKKLYAVAALLLILAGVVAGTVAYFTASRVTHNVITTGNIDIALKETTLKDGKEEPYPTAAQSALVPGEEVSKIVRVENVGEHPAWVRVRVELVAEDSRGNVLEDAKQNLLLNYHTAPGDDWLYEDGYYYYKEMLAAGDETTPLFDTVTFLSSMGNAYQEASIAIQVQAQGVQAENNPIPSTPEAADVTDVKGWPKLSLPTV